MIEDFIKSKKNVISLKEYYTKLSNNKCDDIPIRNAKVHIFLNKNIHNCRSHEDVFNLGKRAFEEDPLQK